jgi:hypothetical protein
LPKRYTQFAARFLQTCKSVATRAARIDAGSSANFAFFYIPPNRVLSAIVVHIKMT